jgi:hypothetical protein
MPWSREVLEAADLGALKVQPQMADVKRALASAAAAWGTGLDDAVIFVGRQREPLHIPDAMGGRFILNPHQEAFAYLPETGRFRQLTAEDGHVVAVARSPDRRRILVVTAQTLIKGEKPGLDGVAVRELTLATMSVSPPAQFPGAMADLLVHATPHGFLMQVVNGRGNPWFTLGSNGALVPAGAAARIPVVAAVRAWGTDAVNSEPIGGACGIVARDRPGKGGAARVIEVTARGRSRIIGEPFGAGLAGLPLPR